jgi:hypothetical protein
MDELGGLGEAFGFRNGAENSQFVIFHRLGNRFMVVDFGDDANSEGDCYNEYL